MSFVNVIEKMASIPNFFLSSRTANFKNFGISSITSKRKMKWVIKVKLEAKKVLQSVQNFFLFQCLQDGNQMITCSILKMKLMILMGIKSREVGPRGLLLEEEGKILG